jgi:hypothetical protein
MSRYLLLHDVDSPHFLSSFWLSITLSVPNVCDVWFCTSNLISYFIKKFKVIEKNKCILKLLYIINHIIFNFFITLIFLIKQRAKINIKNKTSQIFMDWGSTLVTLSNSRIIKNDQAKRRTDRLLVVRRWLLLRLVGLWSLSCMLALRPNCSVSCKIPWHLSSVTKSEN